MSREAFRLLRICFLAPAALLTLAAAAPQDSTKRLPAFNFSIAEQVMGRKPAPTTSVLFNKVQAALEVANSEDSKAFLKAFQPWAALTIKDGFNYNFFSVELLQAVKQSCKGPYQYDEGEDWTQFSWVCDTSGDTPLARYVTLADSPELTASVWFDGQLIKEMSLKEPLWVPGAPRVSAGAYTRAKK